MLPPQRYSHESITIDSTIQSVGEPTIASPMGSAHLCDSDLTPLFIDEEQLDELSGKEPEIGRAHV